jgi:hypothetical protein
MIPRIATSKKWTALPAELCGQIREVFQESFSDASKRGKFHIEGRIYPAEMMLRVGYLENGRLLQANFEVSMDFNSAKQNALEQIHFAIDCAASLLQEFFEREQDLEEFPREWQPIQFEKREIFIQITTENSELEAEANRLLGLSADALVQGSDEATEAAADEKAVISMLGLDKEDFEGVESDDDSAGEDSDDADADSSDPDDDSADDDSDDAGADENEPGVTRRAAKSAAKNAKPKKPARNKSKLH